MGMKEQLKQEHEEEINALMEENSKLEEDLQKAEMMVSQLKAELNKYEEGGEAADSPLNASGRSNREVDDEMRKLREERNQLNSEREDLEKEMEMLELEREEYQKEKKEWEASKGGTDKERTNLKKQNAKLNQLQEEIDNE